MGLIIKCTDFGCSHNDGETCTNEIMLEKNKNSCYVSITDCNENENDSDEVMDDGDKGYEWDECYPIDYGDDDDWDDEEEEEE